MALAFSCCSGCIHATGACIKHVFCDSVDLVKIGAASLASLVFMIRWHSLNKAWVSRASEWVMCRQSNFSDEQQRRIEKRRVSKALIFRIRIQSKKFKRKAPLKAAQTLPSQQSLE
jgi:hypothetical protein